MRVAALYDIHGNLPALEAVLSEVRLAKVDQIIVGGDVLPGPMPDETLACLLGCSIPMRFLLGNGEVAALEALVGKDPSKVPKQYWPGIRWNARQLSSEHSALIVGWRKTVRMEIPGLGGVLFCHATPRNEDEIFTRLTPEDRLAPIFERAGADAVVCGHTHMQFDRRLGTTRVLNAGSVGMPFGEPGADWLLLGQMVEFRHTSYDLAAAAARIRATAYPDAEEFVTRYVLQPPSEREMLDVFNQAQLAADAQ